MIEISRRTLFLGVAASAVCAAGCNGARAVTGPYVAGGYTVTLARTWSDMSTVLFHADQVHFLSIDGPLLNGFYLATLAPGQSLVKLADKHSPVPTYRTDMNDSE